LKRHERGCLIASEEKMNSHLRAQIDELQKSQNSPLVTVTLLRQWIDDDISGKLASVRIGWAFPSTGSKFDF
jgi:hypothetical protein